MLPSGATSAHVWQSERNAYEAILGNGEPPVSGTLWGGIGMLGLTGPRAYVFPEDPARIRRRGAPESPSMAGTVARAMRTESAQRLIAASYILAIAMPPLGLVLAIVVGTRLGGPYSKHAKWIVLVCIAAGAIWAVIISNGALTATNNSY
jgi:hypothetical protein